MRRIICTTAAALITITSANAEMGAVGPGTGTCDNFTRFYLSSPKLAEGLYFSWAQGFLTGVNGIAIAKKDATDRDLSSIPVEQQEQHLRDYCNDHPLALYMQAVVDLYLKFKLTHPRQ
jgi:hypothetical protein